MNEFGRNSEGPDSDGFNIVNNFLNEVFDHRNNVARIEKLRLTYHNKGDIYLSNQDGDY